MVIVPFTARLPPTVTFPPVVIVVADRAPIVALLNDAFDAFRVGVRILDATKLETVKLLAVAVLSVEVVAVNAGAVSVLIVAFYVLKLLATTVTILLCSAIRLLLTVTLLAESVELDNVVIKASGAVAD